MRRKRFWLLLLLGFLLVACGDEGAPAEARPNAAATDQIDSNTITPEPAASYREVKADINRDRPDSVPADDLARLAAGNNAFAFDLYRAVDRIEENVVLAPVSVNMALAMTYAGARGETAAELAAALHYDLPPDRLHPALGQLIDTYTSWTDFDLELANSLWVDDETAPVPAFLDLMAVMYDSGLFLVDFDAGREAAEAMNGWIGDATNGRFQDVIQEGMAGPGTALVLVNAVYFQAEWVNKFSGSSTRDEPFTLRDGAEVDVPIMHRNGGMRYAETEALQYVELPYASDQAAIHFGILLPAPGGFDAVAQSVTADLLAELNGAAELKEVHLHLPRFTFDSGNLPLKATLQSLGVARLFDGADLSGMLADPSQVSNVTHRAFIALDETRTEAAGVTVVEVTRVTTCVNCPEPVVMDVNRPFLFVIYDQTHEVILFMGHVVDPR